MIYKICTVGLLFFAFGAGAEPRLVSVVKIWDAGGHNAFTDLMFADGQWWCVFREADGHVKGDGRIRVIRSRDGEGWESAAVLAEGGVDLRDPKISVMPDGRYMLVMGGSVYRGEKLVSRQPRVAFSRDGVAWTPTQRVMTEGEWLWRVTWHEGIAYGVSYAPQVLAPSGGEDGAWRLTLVKSADGLAYETIRTLEVSDRGGETTLRFLDDDTMVALVRREEGDQSGWIGTSAPPYTEWSWHSTGHRFGGPNFVVLPDGLMWAGNRSYSGGATTVLAQMTTTSYEPMLTLPSGGDTSYPGLVWHEGMVWMSYYSSHEGKTCVYLAKIDVSD